MEGFHICRYNTERFPFYERFQQLMGCTKDPLALLHEESHWPKVMPLCPFYHEGLVVAGINLPEQETTASSTSNASTEKMERRKPVPLFKKRKQFRKSPNYLAFLKLYREWVQTVLANIMPASESYGLVYQCPPTFRCHLGNNPVRTNGRLHCDADYDPHQVNELNVWLPVTNVRGNSSLWLESAPGRGDYKSLDLKYGEFAIFWGHRCRHFINPNDTGTTRISFDLRIVPSSLFVPESKERKEIRHNQKWEKLGKQKRPRALPKSVQESKGIVIEHYSRLSNRRPRKKLARPIIIFPPSKVAVGSISTSSP